MKMETEKGKSLVETPSWAVASVVSVMVLVGFFIDATLGHTEKWLYRTKRKALIAALDKIKEELMLFAVLSLLMGHWIVYAAKICVKSSAISSDFYLCSVEPLQHQLSLNVYSNYSVSRQVLSHKHNEICPEVNSSFPLFYRSSHLFFTLLSKVLVVAVPIHPFGIIIILVLEPKFRAFTAHSL